MNLSPIGLEFISFEPGFKARYFVVLKSSNGECRRGVFQASSEIDLSDQIMAYLPDTKEFLIEGIDWIHTKDK